MKKSKVLAFVFITAMSFVLFACKNGADDAGSEGDLYKTLSADLPPSVGANELSGRTWSRTYDYGRWKDTWEFTDTHIKRVSMKEDRAKLRHGVIAIRTTVKKSLFITLFFHTVQKILSPASFTLIAA